MTTSAPNLFLVAFAVFTAFCGFSAGAGDIQRGDVVVVPITGEISDAQTAFLRRSLKQAESAGASAFVLEMNTPGGELQSAVDIVQLLLKSRIPTYTWVNTNAGSAGSLIALATDHIYMAPVSAIGAAAPVSSEGADIPETMNAKIVSYFSGYFRSAAQAKGRNPALADAFMNKDKEFKVGNQVLKPTGALLTLSAQEAVQKVDGKPLLADGIADSLSQLEAEAHLRGAIVHLAPTGFERIAQWITLLAPLFLVAGIAAAYIEFKSPGFGVAGFVSLACFAIFFLGHYIAGLSGFEVVAVFILGLALLLLEIFLFPGVTFVALTGIALMLGSLLFAMVDYYPGDSWIPDPQQLARPTVNLGLAVILSAIAIVLLARFFPKLPLLHRLMLPTTSAAGTSLAKSTLERPLVIAGMIGIARSILRPAGKAEIDGMLVDVVTEGEFLDAGTALRVLDVEGSRIVVGAEQSADQALPPKLT
jgi:membrane-bound serine protease (ClpP class)